jgi:hypothetical protein
MYIQRKEKQSEDYRKEMKILSRLEINVMTGDNCDVETGHNMHGLKRADRNKN